MHACIILTIYNSTVPRLLERFKLVLDDKEQSRERKEVISYHCFVTEEEKQGVTSKKDESLLSLTSKGQYS